MQNRTKTNTVNTVKTKHNLIQCRVKCQHIQTLIQHLALHSYVVLQRLRINRCPIRYKGQRKDHWIIELLRDSREGHSLPTYLSYFQATLAYNNTTRKTCDVHLAFRNLVLLGLLRDKRINKDIAVKYRSFAMIVCRKLSPPVTFTEHFIKQSKVKLL